MFKVCTQLHIMGSTQSWLTGDITGAVEPTMAFWRHHGIFLSWGKNYVPTKSMAALTNSFSLKGIYETEILRCLLKELYHKGMQSLVFTNTSKQGPPCACASQEAKPCSGCSILLCQFSYYLSRC